MKGSIRQRSPGSWELTVDLGRNAKSKRQRSPESHPRHHLSAGQSALSPCVLYLLHCPVWYNAAQSKRLRKHLQEV